MNINKILIRVLVVDDSDLVRKILKDILQTDTSIKVIGEAENGKIAVELTKRLKPNVIIMDIQMPVMDGFDATEHIMADAPTPILIFSSAIDKVEAYSSVKAISLGALDIMAKPEITENNIKTVTRELINKVRILARIPVLPHIHGKKRHNHTPDPAQDTISTTSGEDRKSKRINENLRSINKPAIIAIGASTGGPVALEKLLSPFPADFPVGIVVVLHIAGGFIDSYCEWLGKGMRLNIKVAEKNEKIEPGTVYFSPDNVQMLISADKNIILDKYMAPWGVHKPSVNHLFSSVGQYFGSGAIGTILTGMGDDGAEGMKIINDHGGYTISQDQNTSLIFGMPKSAIDNGSVKTILPLEEIAPEIIKMVALTG